MNKAGKANTFAKCGQKLGQIQYIRHNDGIREIGYKDFTFERNFSE